MFTVYTLNRHLRTCSIAFIIFAQVSKFQDCFKYVTRSKTVIKMKIKHNCFVKSSSLNFWYKIKLFIVDFEFSFHKEFSSNCRLALSLRKDFLKNMSKRQYYIIAITVSKEKSIFMNQTIKLIFILLKN